MKEITAEIYAWLTSIDLFDITSNFNINEKGNVELDQRTSNKVANGIFFKELFIKLNEMLNQFYGNIYKNDPKLYDLIDDDNPHTRIKNWDILAETLKNYYGIILDSNFKTLLVALDNDTFMDLFNRLMKFYIELEEKVKTANKENENKEREKLKDMDPDVYYYEKKYLENPNTETSKANSDQIALPKIRFYEDYVQIDNLVVDKPVAQTRSVLEFIIVLLCQSLSMNAKQAAALLANNRKYLNHILIKGVRRDYKPVIAFYQEVLSNISHFMNLIEINSISFPNQISKNIEMSLSCFKPGLLSKNFKVVQICGRVMSKLAFELIERNLISAAWNWFIMPDGGLEACILALKKHNSAAEIVVALLTNFGRFHLFELFTVYLKNFINNEGSYFIFMADISEELSKLKFFTDEFIKNKIKDYFFDHIFEASDSFLINVKINSLSFLAELWTSFSFYLEDEAENFKILNTFKKVTRDSDKLVRFSSLNQLFRILMIFAKERNSFAPTIYKTLTFYLIENHMEVDIREFIISNFRYVYKTILSIPVGILSEPYIKQINFSLNKTYFFNTIDINFFITLANHPRLNIKDAIMILDVLGKVFFENVYFYKVIKGVFVFVLSRYLMNEIGVEFCFNYYKLLIEAFCCLDKPNSDKIYLNALKLGKNPETELALIKPDGIDLNNFLVDLAKTIIIDMCIDILQINNIFINNVVKMLLVMTDLIHYDIYCFHNVGISKILDYFGNSQDIVQYYNINNEELEINKEFEGIIKAIYNKKPELPESKESENKLNKKASSNVFKGGKFAKLVEKDINYIKEKKKELNTIKEIKEELLRQRDDKFLKKKIKSNNQLIKKEGIGFFERNNTLSYNLHLLNLNNEEDPDLIVLKKFIKDYNRFFKYMFSRYMGSIYHPIQGKLFNAVKEVHETIAPSEVVKMFREHDICNKLLHKDEVLLIIGSTNLKVFNKQSSKSGLNLDEFIETFIQVSFFCFNRPPYNYAHFTVEKYALEMIKLFTKNAIDRGMDITEYKKLEEVLSNEEITICDFLNEKLRYNNLFDLPEAYTKYLDTEVHQRYYVPDCMFTLLGEGYKIAMEILDEVIFNSIGVHTLEPYVKVKEVYKAKPINIHSYNIKPITEVEPILKLKKAPTSTSLRRYRHDTQPEPLKKILSQRMDSNKRIEQIAAEDDVSGDGNNIITNESLNTDKQILSRINSRSKPREERDKSIGKKELDKLVQVELEKRQNLEKENKRRLRVQYIKQEIEKQKEQKRDKSQKKTESELEKKKESEKLKQKMQQDAKIREKIRAEIAKIKQSKMDEKIKRKEEEKNAILEQAKKRTELNEAFNNKHFKNLEKELKKIKDDRELEAAQQRIAKTMKFRKEEEEKTRFNKILEDEKKIKEHKQKLFNDIKELYNYPSLKPTFDNYNEHFKHLFDIYSKNTENIKLQDFHHFCSHFNILNLLLENDELLFIFKRLANKGAKVEINYDAFKQSLMYCLVFALDKFKELPKEDTNVVSSNINVKENKYYEKITEQRITNIDSSILSQFFDFVGLVIPYDRKQVDQYVNLHKTISTKDKNMIIKDKAKSLRNNLLKN
jgi:hypothetical protein